MHRLALAIDPLLDAAPVDMAAFQRGSLLQRIKSLSTLKPLLKAGKSKCRHRGMMSDLQGGERIVSMPRHKPEPPWQPASWDQLTCCDQLRAAWSTLLRAS